MTDGVDDDLGLGRFVEDHIGIGQGRHAPDGRIVCARADAGIQQKKIDDRLNAGLKRRAPCGEWAAM